MNRIVLFTCLIAASLASCSEPEPESDELPPPRAVEPEPPPPPRPARAPEPDPEPSLPGPAAELIVGTWKRAVEGADRRIDAAARAEGKAKDALAVAAGVAAAMNMSMTVTDSELTMVVGKAKNRAAYEVKRQRDDTLELAWKAPEGDVELAIYFEGPDLIKVYKGNEVTALRFVRFH